MILSSSFHHFVAECNDLVGILLTALAENAFINWIVDNCSDKNLKGISAWGKDVIMYCTAQKKDEFDMEVNQSVYHCQDRECRSHSVLFLQESRDGARSRRVRSN